MHRKLHLGDVASSIKMGTNCSDTTDQMSNGPAQNGDIDEITHWLFIDSGRIVLACEIQVVAELLF